MRRAMMKALRLPFRRKLLFARVSLALLALHLGLRVLPFARVARLVRRGQRPSEMVVADPLAVEDACWAVNRAGGAWLGDRGCLAQSLLGERMLNRLGVPARMRIGVRKDPATGALLAHAWVEDATGRVMIGGSASPVNFQNLPEIQRAIEERGRA